MTTIVESMKPSAVCNCVVIECIRCSGNHDSVYIIIVYDATEELRSNLRDILS